MTRSLVTLVILALALSAALPAQADVTIYPGEPTLNGVCYEETQPFVMKTVPWKFFGRGLTNEFKMTRLCAPASADGAVFYLVWRGDVCDSRANVGIAYTILGEDMQTHTDVVWFKQTIPGIPTYFNDMALDHGEGYGLTIMDNHEWNLYSLGVQVNARLGKALVWFTNKAQIPLPPEVRKHLIH